MREELQERKVDHTKNAETKKMNGRKKTDKKQYEKTSDEKIRDEKLLDENLQTKKYPTKIRRPKIGSDTILWRPRMLDLGQAFICASFFSRLFAQWVVCARNVIVHYHIQLR